MSLIDDIKNQVKKTGSNKGKFIYFKPGLKVRVRFLQNMEEGAKVPFHDSYAKGVNLPCQTVFGRKCPYCEDEELRTRDQYLWSVWDHEAKEVKILMAPVNNCSPIPSLVGMYETYGTIVDRDYVITKNGSQTSSTYSVVPMDKVKFRNDKAKPFSKTKLLELLDKAFPDDGASEVDEEDEEPEDKPKSVKKSSKPSKPEKSDEYDGMSARELYDICKEKDIDVQPKKDAQYYVDKLHDAGYPEEDEDGWSEEDEDELEWDEDMSPKELYEVCTSKGLKVPPKKPALFYIEKLKEADGEKDGEDTEEEW